MDSSSSSSSQNLYNVLGVPSSASYREIKRARDNLARHAHPDRQGNEALMQAINNAWEVLSDPVKRDKYDNNREDRDDDYSSSTVSGVLSSGHKLSDDFKAKIRVWKAERAPSSDKTFFVDPSFSDPFREKTPSSGRNYSAAEEKMPSSKEVNPAQTAYQKLLNSSVQTVNTLLSEVMSATVCKWVFKKISLLRKEILDSSAWKQELPPSSDSPLSKIDYRSLRDQLSKEQDAVFRMLGEIDRRYVYPDVQPLQVKLAKYIQEKSTSIFKTTERHPVGTKIPLCPASMEEELGLIPHHVVTESSVVVDTKACECSACVKPFGLFRWQSNCISCGSGHCNDCLTYSYLPDYTTPVQVCGDCKPNLPEKLGPDWLTPLENAEGRARITSQYLSLMAAEGYLEQEKFLELAALFFREKRYDLAIQCNHLGQGNWMDLAARFLEEKQYSFAKICLHSIGKRTKEWWSEQGIAHLKRKPYLALLAFQKAEYAASDYIKIAFEYSEFEVSKLCMTLVLTANRSRDLLDEIVAKAVEEDKVILAFYALILGKCSVDQWIKYINKIPIEKAAPFIKCMNDALGFSPYSWNNVHFSPDRDHLRWDFMPHADFDSRLRYLIDSFERGDSTNSILYFRSKMKDENFVVLRDEYLAQGEYTKAFICHRLISNGISWSELAKKWRSKDESATLACYLLETDNVGAFGDRLFEEGEFSLALRAYLQAGEYAKIEEKTKIPGTSFRLLYLFALSFYHPKENDLILDLCRTLLSDRSNRQAVQQIVIAALKDRKNRENLAYHQMLAEAGISDVELVGLVDTVHSLCRKPSEKEWWTKSCLSVREKVWNSLRKAIFDGSLKDIVGLVDLINPLTLLTVRKLLAEFAVDQMERGPKKSRALLVRAVASMFQLEESHFLDAMNDVTEAMLGDPGEENFNSYAQIVEKISQHIGTGWNLRGGAATSLQKRDQTEFAKRLQLNPHLRVLIEGEKSISKLDPYEAAMAYIDLSQGIAYAPGLVGSYLSAAHELSKVMHSHPVTYNKEEQYPYRPAIVELVSTAYVIGRSHLCPATQLYVIRSGIAILTMAYKPFYYISKSEQELLDSLYSEIDQLSKASPVMLGKMVLLFDVVYLDLINREFSAVYFPLMRTLTNKTAKPDPRYQYHIFAERWKGNFDEKIFKFEEERRRTMEALLKEKGNTMKDVQAIMQWPAIVRDEEGWLPEQPLPLHLNEDKFSRINGVRYDKVTGEIEFLVESSPDPMEAVFDLDDIADVLQKGVTGSMVTLEEEDPELRYHPCQKIKYLPDCISRTNHLATLLHADIRLKEITQGVEISANLPFALRDAQESLLKRLPEGFQKELKERYEDMSDTTERVCRYWIEAGNLPYYQTENDKEMVFKFGDCDMSVKTHKMMRNQYRNLVDTPEDTDRNSPDGKMAALLTREYATLGKVFPEFKRLEELAKLQAMVRVVQGIYQNVIAQYERAYGREKERILGICNAFKRAGIALQTDVTAPNDKCAWVPSAFKMKGHRRVYGGVNLNANLVSGGGGGSNGGVMRARYVESMDTTGVIRGHGYNSQGTQFLYLKSSVLDQYNSWMSRPPNITAFWRTSVGYTDVHHHTTHTNNFSHTHRVNGWAQCRNPDGTSQYYRSGDRSHRCGQGEYG